MSHDGLTIPSEPCHGRQFPDATDQWDGNWLRVTVQVRDLNAQAWISSSILTTTDLAAWRSRCESFLSGGASRASLEPLEPELEVTMRETDQVAHLEMCVDATPDHLRQEHRFRIEIDQSYLLGLISELGVILGEFPLR